ncbi:MAG TPA: S24 family peptidase [Azospirillaceae bacterium]|nr:S24 family peptidase [Azospirillaceae bacterium]
MTANEPTDVAKTLRALREQAGFDRAEFARLVGMAYTTYQNYETRWNKPYLPYEFINKILPILVARGIDRASILALVEPLQAEVTISGEGTAVDLSSLRPITMDRGNKLPIYASAQAGPEGMVIEANPIDWIDRPEALANVKDAYGVYVVNDSMEPRYEQGDLLLVNPHRPARPGNHVVIQLKDNRALVKRLVRRVGANVRVAQYNPAKEYDLPSADIAAIHVVIGAMSDP